jgi:hypothetical protein
MPDSFISGVGGKLADQVLVQFYTPAYLFWASGLGLYARANWSWLQPKVATLSETRIILLAAILVLLVAATAAIGQRCEPTLIRLLEGYHWPKILNRLGAQRFHERLARNDKIRQRLAGKVYGGTATQGETKAFNRADLDCHDLPPNPDDIMPTKLGNVLRAAERRIYDKYGLDPRICWSRLWAVIPKDDRDDLSAVRDALDIGARSFFWGGLFVAWTPWSWWAIPVAIAALLASYAWMVNAAGQYGETLEAAFDVFRFSLYKSLNIDLPVDVAHEVAHGKRVTAYLWRGVGDFTFTKTPSKDAAAP